MLVKFDRIAMRFSVLEHQDAVIVPQDNLAAGKLDGRLIDHESSPNSPP